LVIRQHLVVSRFNPEVAIAPTKLKLSIVIKIDDIIFPGFQAVGDAICYMKCRYAAIR
jgi:hypothetical protein